MRMLVAIDKSPSSEAAVAEVGKRALPGGTEIEVLTVVHSDIPRMPYPALTMAAVLAEDLRRQEEEAPEVLRAAADRIQRDLPQVRITTKVLEGAPTEVIVQEAADWKADVIILGSHGRKPLAQALIGSTASSVAAKADCTVEIIKGPADVRLDWHRAIRGDE